MICRGIIIVSIIITLRYSNVPVIPFKLEKKEKCKIVFIRLDELKEKKENG